MELTGKSIIGYQSAGSSKNSFCGIDPRSGEELEPKYHSASMEELNQAVDIAKQAFIRYRHTTPEHRASFLRSIAENIENLAEELLERVSRETALPAARVLGERGRTCNQLRMFATLIEEGSWVEACIEYANPDQTPLPKPDLRSMRIPIGPVAVFGASNFPLAFSVAGGDTASALAAGNPVIVKAHAAHPGTGELVGHAIKEAALACDMPEGVFSLLFDSEFTVGQALVQHPAVKAVAFTGSIRGGRALMDLSAKRAEPIPVFAEMGSSNPVFLLPQALRERGEEIATGLHQSVTLGAGQFCTNPGLIILPECSEAQVFSERLASLMAETAELTMLTNHIRENYNARLDELRQTRKATALEEQIVEAGPGGSNAGAALFKTSAEAFMENETLREEVFGPATLIVSHSGPEQVNQVADALNGQLTATIHGTAQDLENYRELIAILETKAGRIVMNGFPTGVEVCHAIVHGGPYPASSNASSTSVGTRAISRFTRLVCYQNFPEAELPNELKEMN